jgi:hypothetical protein
MSGNRKNWWMMKGSNHQQGFAQAKTATMQLEGSPEKRLVGDEGLEPSTR